MLAYRPNGNGQVEGRDQKGSGLIEVMLAMVILAFAVVGVMGMFHWADHGMQYGAKATRALAMAGSRLEAKRALPWGSLLTDDLDADGLPEITMRDDGGPYDAVAGDGVFTAGVEQEGIQLVWRVQPDRPGPLTQAGSVLILAEASYQVGKGQKRSIRLGTLRANPRYLGIR